MVFTENTIGNKEMVQVENESVSKDERPKLNVQKIKHKQDEKNEENANTHARNNIYQS